MTDKDVFKIGDVSQLLGITKKEVMELIRMEEIPYFWDGGGIRVERQLLFDWLRIQGDGEGLPSIKLN